MRKLAFWNVVFVGFSVLANLQIYHTYGFLLAHLSDGTHVL